MILLYVGFLFYSVCAGVVSSCEDGAYNLVKGTRCLMYTKCENGQWFLKQCKIGQIFDPATLRCQSGTELKCLDGTVKCEEGTTHSHPGSNRLYYQCLHGRVSTRYCSIGEVFDHKAQSCLINTETLSSGFHKISGSHFISRTRRNTNEVCIENSKHRDGKSCRDYIECNNGVEVKKTCPDCMNYDEVSKGCRFNLLLPCGPNSVMPTPQPTTATTTTKPTPRPTPATTTTEPTPQPTPATSPKTTPQPDHTPSSEKTPSREPAITPTPSATPTLAPTAHG